MFCTWPGILRIQAGVPGTTWPVTPTELVVLLRCDPEKLVLIMMGRLELDEAERENRISYEGESAAAHRFFALIGNS